jgi:ABC-2 type transport system permease protein
MRAAFILALKDLRLLSRDPVALFWVLGFPVLFATFFGSVMEAGASGKAAAWSVLVVDEADSVASRKLVDSLSRSESLKIERATAAEAASRVEHGKALAFVRIRQVGEGAPADGVEVGVDPAQRVQGQLLAQVVNGALSAALAPELPPGAPRALPAPRQEAELRLVTSDAKKPGTSYEVVFPAALLWGLMGCAAAFAVSLVTEATTGTLVRLRAAPIPRAAILGGKALACFIACTADMLLLWGFAAAALHVRVAAPLHFLAALFSTVTCFVGITMTLACLGRTEQAVAGAGWSTLIVLSMLGGAMVPRSFMPEWLQRIGTVSPVHWGIYAMEGATWRGFTGTELLVPCAILVTIGMVGFVVGLAMMGRQR